MALSSIECPRKKDFCNHMSQIIEGSWYFSVAYEACSMTLGSQIMEGLLYFTA